MNHLDLAYFVAANLAGAAGRTFLSSLPEAFRQRLEARPPEGLEPGWVWVQAVSVGELLLAPGLLEKCLRRGERVHVTTGTTAGLDLLRRRAPEWDQGRGLLTGGAFPLDDSDGLRPFLASPPKLFLALETELWPNLLRELEGRGIPKVIVNGRLTARSEGSRVLRQAARRLDLVAARDADSAAAFRALGAPNVRLGGNLKSDLPPPRPLPEFWAPLHQAWAADPVVVAGNTVEGEEALVVAAWQAARGFYPSLRLIMAPRKPARFEASAALLDGQGLRFERASAWPNDADWRDVGILLLDTLGDLPAAYGEGTVGLVGGGWTWTGGHNPLEPVRWGIPTITGPGGDNFRDLLDPLILAGSVIQVPPDRLGAALLEQLGKASLRGPGMEGGPALPSGLGGALERTWNLVLPFLLASGTHSSKPERLV